jgi:osmotically-inducible protein OsmY
MHEHFYAHQDDHPDLTDDELAALIDTSGLSVTAIGRAVILSGYVASVAEIGCAEEAAASVIGVHLVENRLEVRDH